MEPLPPSLDSSRESSPPRKKHGGRRSGAGRKPGSKNTLPQGYVATLKASGLRVPPNATEAERELADVALSRMVDVMMEQVHHKGAYSVLSAARAVREEVCGPVAQKHEHSGEGGGPLEVVIRDIAKEEG